jgi:hypothetical protein
LQFCSNEITLGGEEQACEMPPGFGFHARRSCGDWRYRALAPGIAVDADLKAREQTNLFRSDKQSGS